MWSFCSQFITLTLKSLFYLILFILLTLYFYLIFEPLFLKFTVVFCLLIPWSTAKNFSFIMKAYIFFQNRFFIYFHRTIHLFLIIVLHMLGEMRYSFPSLIPLSSILGTHNGAVVSGFNTERVNSHDSLFNLVQNCVFFNNLKLKILSM